MSTTSKRFGANLKALRGVFMYTQEAAAELLGAKRSTYATWENANSEPSLEKLELLQSLSGVGLDAWLSVDFGSLERAELVALWAVAKPRGLRNRETA